MSIRPARSPFAALVAAAFSLAACGDGSTSAPASLGLASPDAAGLSAGRTPNAVRYRDAGKRPAVGRSGAASLQALALIGRDGATTLEVVSGAVATPGVARGEIAKLQVKRFAPDGALLGTRNLAPGSSHAEVGLLGMAPGSSVQLQANVRGIDRSRTDVVTVATPVLRRPDLLVSGLQLPSFTTVGVPVIVAASVAEVNGDVGARASCVLSVDGVDTDAAPGIWVDAGDAVSCAFSHVFSGVPGRRTLQVRVEDAQPVDDDATNNAVSGVVDVRVAYDMTMGFYAYAFDHQIVRHDSLYSLVQSDGAPLYEGWTSLRSFGRSQGADFFGFLDDPVTFPLTQLLLAQRTAGATTHQAVLTDVESDYESEGSTCAAEDLERGVTVAVCATSARTDVRYLRRSGTVTYHSLYYARAWYRDESGVPYYIGNVYPDAGSDTRAAPYFPLGDEYEFDVRLEDDGRRYGRTVAVAIPPAEISTSLTPWTCTDGIWDGVPMTSCSEIRQTTEIRFGVRHGAAGEP